MNTEDIVAGIIFGLLSICFGFNLTFRRKITDSLLASNKVFWTKMGFSPDERVSRTLTNIMIPVMGLVFMTAGVASSVKVIMYFLHTY